MNEPSATDRDGDAGGASTGPSGRKRRFRRTVSAMAALVAVLVFGVAIWAAWGLQRVDLDKPPGSRPSVMLEAADGTPLGQGGSYAGPVRREDIPAELIEALVAIEDRRFYEHLGFDPVGIVRAAWRNARAGGVVEGGSTLTQQLAKVLFLDPERTVRRKLQEALIATWLDLRLTKDEILVKYLDSVYFGAGATGVSAAAEIYFDKPVRELTLAESAMLAGLVRAPSKLNPLADLEAARERASVVVNAMVEAGHIGREEALAALLRPATPVRTAQSARTGGWFADWLQSRAEEAIEPLAGAARIRTTFQPRLQAIAENAVRATLDRAGQERNAGQAALVAMTPDGAVVAMVGGRSYEESQFNRAVNSQRQPGSAFTIFVYLAALRLGWSLDDTILDAPLEIDGWSPKNFPDRYSGEVTLEQAFARSLNTPTVRLAQQVGMSNVIQAARDMGIASEIGDNLAVSLGTAEVSLLDLTGAYASFAARRRGLEPWAVAGLSDEAGAEPTTVPAREAAPELEHGQDMIRLLQAAVREGTGGNAGLQGFVAGKTGTSQEYRDAWFVGFTDTLVAGVWVGNDDNSPMHEVTGGDLPAEIWQEFMSRATGVAPREPPVPTPPGALPPAASREVAGPEPRPVSRTQNDVRPAPAETRAPGEQVAPEPRNVAGPAGTDIEAVPSEATDEPPPVLGGRPATAGPSDDGPSILFGGRGLPGRAPRP